MDIADIGLLELQPSQFYISQKKLENVKSWFVPHDLSNFEPLPVKILKGRLILTDGHTRAVAAYQAGLRKVPLVWEPDEWDWKLIQTCVEGCLARQIHSVADLSHRVISGEEYQQKWIAWCERQG